MSRQTRQFWSLAIVGLVILTGCHPTQPFYLNSDGDLSHYLDVATDIEYPDVAQASLEEVDFARDPMTISHPDFDSLWDLSLEEAINITLQNSKVLRLVQDQLLLNPDSVSTIYDPALQETNPGGYSARIQGRPTELSGSSRFAPGSVVPTGQEGVEAALSEFDAVFSASASLNKGDQPATSSFFPNDITSDTGRGQFQIAKHTAVGTNYYIRNVTNYSQSSQSRRLLPSQWDTNFEIEARHPLLRGSGTQVNRVPVVLARIRTDVSLADFEGNVRDLINNTEQLYWNLYFAYRTLETAKEGRDSALRAWRTAAAKREAGGFGGERHNVAQAQEQYFAFRATTEEALCNLYDAETRLRFLMGLSATDGRLIRPIDEPTMARIDFQWCDIHAEALVRRVELRRQKWRIAQREQEMIFARNALLPSLDVVGLYRWLGVGDDLISANRTGAEFPDDGSTAFEELTRGQYQEYGVGLEFQVPLGFRKELAGVRHAELQMARDRAVLEDMELNVSHQLTRAVQDLDCNYLLAQTNFNRRAAAKEQVDALQNLYDAGAEAGGRGGGDVLDLLLDAQRRLAVAENAYYRSLVDYNLAIKTIHYNKGSLLEYNGVILAEGPWPQKAYHDALNLARQRDASYYLDYGFSRPRVISQGAFPQHQGNAEESGFEYEVIPPEELGPGQPTPAAEFEDELELHLPTQSY